ncbi:MAG: hypothetical protein M3R27_03790, partial [Bacteroidota bacterium]|nr:hypothetical protein [Bacteroidota bacterium]
MNTKFTFAFSFIILSLFIRTTDSLAQNVGINSTGASAAASAGLDIDFSNKGLLIPRVALTATNAAGPVTAPATSLLVYNTATASSGSTAVVPGYYYWNGSAWVAFAGTGSANWSLTGNAGTAAVSNFIGTTDAVDWVIRTNNTERMRVTSGGNVGIGITVPTQKLDVQGGNGRINNAFIGDVGHGAGWGGISHSSMGTPTGYSLIESSDGSYTLINKENTGTGYLGFRVGNADMAIITNAGNMGIATTTPAYRLTVAPGTTFGFGDGTASYSSRTESRADAGLQGSSGAQSGFFQTSVPSPSANWPTSTANATPGFDASGNATSWWHLIDARHSNDGNNYAMQFSGGFFDQKLYFRKTAGAANTAWCEVLTSTATIGQSSSTSYTTNAITVTGAGFVYVTGFPVTITVPANSTVLVTADMGASTNSGVASSGYSIVDVA